MPTIHGFTHRSLIGRSAVVALACSALAACSGASSPSASTTPTASLSPSESSTAPASLSAGRELQHLASAAVGYRLDATFRLNSKSPKNPDAVVRVRLRSDHWRIDVTRRGSSGVRATSTLMRRRNGDAISCQHASGVRECFIVAKKGHRVPALFDAGIQAVFVTAVHRFAQRAKQMPVHREGTWTVPGLQGKASCFRVGAVHLPHGVYCLLPRGIIAKVTFPSGSLMLRDLHGQPSKGSFVPPVTPTQLPG